MRSYITENMLRAEIASELASMPDEDAREPPAELDGWDYLIAWLFALDVE